MVITLTRGQRHLCFQQHTTGQFIAQMLEQVGFCLAFSQRPLLAVVKIAIAAPSYTTGIVIDLAKISHIVKRTTVGIHQARRYQRPTVDLTRIRRAANQLTPHTDATGCGPAVISPQGAWTLKMHQWRGSRVVASHNPAETIIELSTEQDAQFIVFKISRLTSLM